MSASWACGFFKHYKIIERTLGGATILLSLHWNVAFPFELLRDSFPWCSLKGCFGLSQTLWRPWKWMWNQQNTERWIGLLSLCWEIADVEEYFWTQSKLLRLLLCSGSLEDDLKLFGRLAEHFFSLFRESFPWQLEMNAVDRPWRSVKDQVDELMLIKSVMEDLAAFYIVHQNLNNFLSGAKEFKISCCESLYQTEGLHTCIQMVPPWCKQHWWLHCWL